MSSMLYLERALFVVGQPRAGKSRHLRGMFRDWRFGRRGQPSRERGPIPPVALSNERMLLIFPSSPQENRLAPQDWLDRIQQAMGSGRWCFAGALQGRGTAGLPDAIQYVQSFANRFHPERIRTCFLSPDGQNRAIGNFVNLAQAIPAIAHIDGAECVFIDAQLEATNGLLLADFFDFS
jgi:hypothetical protein